MLATSDLPTLNAILNTTAAILLSLAYYFIKHDRWKAHRATMIAAVVVSAMFLTSYLIYHAQVGSKPYEGEGILRIIYFLILIPHVILAAVNVPFILLTLWRAYKDPFDGRHRKIARYVWPVWIYVSVTGVLVYIMLYVSEH
ncbi:MAG: DUF420 domain-containing protein [Anaerolineae bacterium]|nr:MAG: DUF420 domain-containing protein [Anaerolineae bacterium]